MVALARRPESKRWWAWSVTREDAVAYTILPSRSQEAARRVLGNYHGIVMADGYGADDALARAGPGHRRCRSSTPRNDNGSQVVPARQDRIRCAN